MRLEGKTAVITGAGRGIGRATAIAFAREGANLGLLDVCADIAGCPYPLATRSQLLATASACRDEGASTVELEADVRDGPRIEQCIAQVAERYGSIDVMVSNAGIVAPAGKLLHETCEDDWALMLDIDLSGAWRCMRAVAPIMIGQRNGSLINVASTAGLVGYRHFSGYVAAKHGLVGLTRAAALDYAAFGIRVNALCPGSVRDDALLEGRMLQAIAAALQVPLEGHEQLFSESQPGNQLVDAHDVAAAAVWLASDESKHVTGSVISIDGGYTAR